MWVVAVFLGAMAAYDLDQRNHAILHNFPAIAHLRLGLEVVGHTRGNTSRPAGMGRPLAWSRDLITEIMRRYAETTLG